MKEGQLPQEHKPAEISLTDCLACSGCVTSAEAVLVSLQSHAEVLNSLDEREDTIFVASVSPQVRASIAATYGLSEREAGWMIEQLLSGPQGLATGGARRNSFKWILDTNVMREVSLVLGAEEVLQPPVGYANILAGESVDAGKPKLPILSSACPGWICYAEKTHPHVLPHLSRLKSPQALTGTVLKSFLSHSLNIRPNQIWHVAIMPCFDKKLEASREELTDVFWRPDRLSSSNAQPPVRDVDCVITARELLMLADSRGISFPSLPHQPLQNKPPFPDPAINDFLFPNRRHPHTNAQEQPKEAGTSGGYLHHILSTQLSLHPDSSLTTTRGRNADVIEYTISSSSPLKPEPIFKAARYYGFRNIQNLVRKLKPPKASRMPGGRGAVRPLAARRGTGAGSAGTDYAYVEVMACPGGCTNGGGQIKVDDLPLQAVNVAAVDSGERMGQKEWLQKVDEAYFSMSDSDSDDHHDEDKRDGDGDRDLEMDAIGGDGLIPTGLIVGDEINGISPSRIKAVLQHWVASTGIPLEKLVLTSYRKVESDVGKVGGAANRSEQVVESIAGKVGGGW